MNRTISLEDARRLVAEGESLSREERLKLQNQRLHELVNYVREKSPYFKELYKDLKEDFSLSDLPHTEKAILLDHYDDWVTDPRLKRQMVLDYVNRDASRATELLLGEYTALHTSGSTGTPLPMVRDDFRNKIHGQLIAQRLMKNSNPELNDYSKYRRASIIHTSPGASSYSSWLRMRAAHADCGENIKAISVLESVDNIVKQLNEFQPDTLVGYPSMIVQLAVEQKSGRLKIHPQSVICSAELLSEENFHFLKEVFGCPVSNNYCMTEGGEVAMTHDCPHLHINEDWIIVEPVTKNSHSTPEGSGTMDFRPTPEGEWSDGILVTDLTNFTQPIIRYYVSDVVRLTGADTPDCSQLPVMEIRGRVCPMYTLCGKTFTLAGLVTKAEVWPNICTSQFVQTSDDTIEVRAICQDESKKQQTLAGLASRLQEYLAEQGCPECHILPSDKPLIPNQRGGKIPLYHRL